MPDTLTAPGLSIDRLYADFVNPQWVRLLEALELDRRFVKAQGAELVTDDGEVYLDLLGGYGVYNVGHNHPDVARALVDEITSLRPSMLQSHIPALAGQLAQRLVRLAGGRIGKACFMNSGSEGVETAVKFARTFTRRDRVLAAEGGFHGLTLGALSLMSNEWWRRGFGALVPGVGIVPFGDLHALERELKTQQYAAFVVEPIQGESGVQLPPEGYLENASRLCDLHGTLLVLDEVQTGLFRTGRFLAAHHFGVEPDLVVLAKALSGGFVPVSAVLMRDDVCKSVYSSAERSFVHASTFGENALSMRAGLATLDVLEKDGLGERGLEVGERLRTRLRAALVGSEMVKAVRGLGMFNAIEFGAPRSITMKLLMAGFARLHPGLFGQMCVRSLFLDSRILTQMAGHNFLALKVLLPLVVTEPQIDRAVAGAATLVDTMKNEKVAFWGQGMKIGARLLGG
ncbi:MAG TPA: aspartate aminotransferase family protein [Planctomycetota bacterium]|nr:aspartate aminotransferase family protein [Planctomycetota bacterium]